MYVGSRKGRAGTEPASLYGGGGREGASTRRRNTENTQKTRKTNSPPKGRSLLATTEQRPLRPQLATTTATRTHTDTNTKTDTWLQRTQLTTRQDNTATPTTTKTSRRQPPHGDYDHDDNVKTPTTNLGQAGNRPKSALYVRSATATEATRWPRKLNRVRRELQYPTSKTQLNK